MKEKILLWLCDYSYRITAYLFWTYFLFVIVLDFFSVKLGKVVTSLFWLLLGFYLGYTAALYIMKYMKEKRK
jgi:hypothetical protein